MTAQKQKNTGQTALVLADSSRTEYLFLNEAILAALNHMGIPYEICDLANTSLAPDALHDHSVILIAQDGLGALLSDAQIEMILTSVRRGVGLVNFDPRLARHPQIATCFGVSFSERPAPVATGILATSNPHYISATQGAEEPKRFAKFVETSGDATSKDPAQVLMETDTGHPALVTSRCDEGRAVQWLISPSIWLNQVFGHANGLDDLFWRSIVWAARKPFAMMAMPPFVTARIDDATGGGREFAYIEVYNRHGYIPAIGVFTDDIDAPTAAAMKQYADAGKVDFAAHAFSYEHLVFFDYHRGPYPDDVQEENFRRVDEIFRKWGVPQARTVNAHYGEWGKNAIPHLRARGQTYVMCWRLPDELAKGVHQDWRPKPYGHFGCISDELPGHPEIYLVTSTPHRPADNIYLPDGRSFLVSRDAYKDDVDHLWRHTTFRRESPENDIEGAARSGARQMRIGLDSLCFGCIHTHEQRLAELSLDELDRMLTRIDDLTAAYPKRFRSFDQIARYAKNRASVTLASAELRAGRIQLRCRGHSEIPLLLYLFEDEGEGVSYELAEIPAVNGECTVSI